MRSLRPLLTENKTNKQKTKKCVCAHTQKKTILLKFYMYILGTKVLVNYPVLKCACLPSDTALGKADFHFTSRYLLLITFSLVVGLCIHFGIYFFVLEFYVHTVTVSEFIGVLALFCLDNTASLKLSSTSGLSTSSSA